MPKTLLKIAAISVIFLYLDVLTLGDNNKDALALAKRALAEREQAFLHSRTMSPDLRSFIEKHRKRRQQQHRAKRDNNNNLDKIDENQFYIVHDGQLIPFNNIRRREDEGKTSTTSTSTSDDKAYTVVPLVIPLGNTNFLKDTIMDEIVKSNLPSSGKSKKSAVNVVRSVEGKRNVESTTPCDEPNVEEVRAADDKEEKMVLQKILDDIEGLMRVRGDGGKKEGVLCNLNGSWDSEAAGMRFDISYKPSTRKKFQIKVAERVPPNDDGFLCDGNWSVYGELPFPHSGVVIVLALHEKDKHLATFIGECRVCEGSETVTGTWLIGRSSRDCKDQKASHKVLSDVWRREEGHTLQKKHLEQLGITMKEETPED